jgi:hypothetical protein
MAKPIIIASKDSFELHSIYKMLISRYAFATFDTNHDGSISFEEFLLALSATSQGDLDDRLAFAFDLYILCIFLLFSNLSVCLTYRYDISNDGQIDQKELANLISAMVHLFLYLIDLM